MKKEKNFIIRLTNVQDDSSVYFTRLVPHWRYIDGQRIYTETVETTKYEKNATVYYDVTSAQMEINKIKDWQPEWAKQYDIIVDELIHPALKLRKLCQPMIKLISLTKSLDIKDYSDETIDINTRKKQKAIYDKIMLIVNDVEPAFIEVFKTVD